MWKKKFRKMDWGFRLLKKLAIFSAVIFLCVFSVESRPSFKIDSVIQARIDSTPVESNKVFSEIPEWKAFSDSTFSEYFEQRRKKNQWEKIKYPLKLNRQFLDSKIKKNKASLIRNKNHSLNAPNGDSGIDVDRIIELELFDEEKLVLVCDSIQYDGAVGETVWKGHLKGFDGSSVRIYSVNKPSIYITISKKNGAPITIGSLFDSGLYLLQQTGPPIFPKPYE